MKRSILKKLIIEVVSIIESPDFLRPSIYGSSKDDTDSEGIGYTQGGNYSILLSQDWKSGCITDRWDNGHGYMRNRLQEIFHYHPEMGDFKYRGVAHNWFVDIPDNEYADDAKLNGLTKINGLFFWNLGDLYIDWDKDSYYGLVGARLFGRDHFEDIDGIVSFWKSISKDTLSINNALYNLLKAVDYSPEHVEYEDPQFDKLSYSEITGKSTSIKSSVDDETTRIKIKISQLEQEKHTADPEQKLVIRSQIQQLLKKLGKDTDDKGVDTTKLGAGSLTMAQKAKKAGFNSISAWNAARQIDETK